MRRSLSVLPSRTDIAANLRQGLLGAAVMLVALAGGERAGHADSLFEDLPSTLLDAFDNLSGNSMLGARLPVSQAGGQAGAQTAAIDPMLSDSAFGTDVTDFNIAGYQLYMTPEAVTDKAVQDGFPVIERDRRSDEDALRAMTLRLSDRDATARLDGQTLPRETLEMGFAVERDLVTRRLVLTYVYDDAEERAQLIDAARAKFGPPTERYDSDQLLWGFRRLDDEDAPVQAVDTARPYMRLLADGGIMTIALVDPTL